MFKMTIDLKFMIFGEVYLKTKTAVDNHRFCFQNEYFLLTLKFIVV